MPADSIEALYRGGLPQAEWDARLEGRTIDAVTLMKARVPGMHDSMYWDDVFATRGAIMRARGFVFSPEHGRYIRKGGK
jgi:hypothetical protein